MLGTTKCVAEIGLIAFIISGILPMQNKYAFKCFMLKHFLSTTSPGIKIYAHLICNMNINDKKKTQKRIRILQLYFIFWQLLQDLYFCLVNKKISNNIVYCVNLLSFC